MQKAWTPPARWVFLVATLLGLFSTAPGLPSHDAQPEARVDGIELGSLLILNLGSGMCRRRCRPDLPASHAFRLDAERWLRSIAIHAAAAIGFSIIHAPAMLAVGCCCGRTCVRCRKGVDLACRISICGISIGR